MHDPSDYCRQLESYLCQKNGGHLIRIVGPAFTQVCGWAELGVPLTVAFRGIDRCVERRQGKTTGRTRPVRIEFCEADILDLFDDWRRAVGIAQPPGESHEERGRKASLASHVERVVARLVARRKALSPAFERHVEGLLSELDRLGGESRTVRGGAARAAVIDRLAVLDKELMQVAATEIDDASSSSARRDAEAELAPFAARMAPEARAEAAAAAYERLVREALDLPYVRFE